MCGRVLVFLRKGYGMKIKGYFTKGEMVLWSVSALLIIFSFYLFGGESHMTLAASLIGTTSLIFNAKANPIGQGLMVVFSILYGIISYTYSYYGEMITYLGMSAPMAVFALIVWLKNPYEEKNAEVAVNQISGKEQVLMWGLNIVVTLVFYFILSALGTANIIPSTVSVTTSFAAVYLTARRSPYFALAYAANDIVLIVLWILASIEKPSYISVVVCFAAFFVNDIYGFINWKRIEKRQRKKKV